MSDTAQQDARTTEAADAQAFDGTTSFSQVNDRLKEIVSAVEDDNLPLDDALALFEEAVGLGMQASSLLEQDLAAREGAAEDTDATDEVVGEAHDSGTAAADAVSQGINGSADTAADAPESTHHQSGGQLN